MKKAVDASSDRKSERRRVSWAIDDEGEITHELVCYKTTDPFDLSGVKAEGKAVPSQERRSSSMAAVDGEPTDTACCGLQEWWLDNAEPGYLWILYQRSMDVAGISSVANWQRREFLWQDTSDEFSLIYMSENLESETRSACLLASEAGSATITMMSPVVLDDVSGGLRSDCCNALMEYEVARGFSNFAGQEDLFQKQVPHMLWPFFIRWIDRDGKEKQKILASASGRRHQHKVISKINREIKRHARSQNNAGAVSCAAGLLHKIRSMWR